MALNDFILGQGEQARKEAEKKPNSRKKTNYVRLKDGETVRGYLLTTDFVMYLAHGDFNKGIKTHTCKAPKDGVGCISCQHQVKRSKKTIVPIYNVDTKQVEVFDASTTAMKAVYAYVDEYEEEATATPISLSRNGSDTSTTYTMMPVRVKPAEKAIFEIPAELIVDEEFYMNVLNLPSDDYIRELLGLAKEDAVTAVDDNVVAVGDDELPF